MTGMLNESNDNDSVNVKGSKIDNSEKCKDNEHNDSQR